MHTTFAPAMQFTLTELEAQPVIGTSSSAPAAQALANLFAPSASGSVTGTRSRPLYLSLILGRMPVATARTIALGGIGAIVGVLVMMLAFARPRRRDETAAIIARYGGLIVQVAHVSQPPGTSVIDVADMESLARIAGHYDRSILHECSADGDAFWVTDESGQFRYAISAQAASAAEPVSTAEMHGTAEMVTRAAVWEDPGIAATTATWAAPAPANDVAASRIVTNDLAASGATANPASASGTAEYQPEPYELVPEPTPSETEAVPRRLSGRYAPI
jgi:hypothetical protein